MTALPLCRHGCGSWGYQGAFPVDVRAGCSACLRKKPRSAAGRRGHRVAAGRCRNARRAGRWCNAARRGARWAVSRWRKRTFERTVTETSCIILQPVLVEAMALLVLQITASFQRCFLLLLINPTAHVHDNFIFFVNFPCFNP